MSSKYVDITATIQVIGSVFNNPELLDITDRYVVTDEDFSNEFHKVVFGAIYKLHDLGAKEITLESVSDFLSSRPKSEAIFKTHKGEEWLIKCGRDTTFCRFD